MSEEQSEVRFYNPTTPLGRLRKYLGLSQSEFGEPILMSRQEVSKLENRLEGLGGERMERVLEVYGIDLKQLGITSLQLLREHKRRT